jgi:adenine phosphoribosyltransferase
LVERLGGEIVQMNFIMEITALQGRQKLGNREILTALTY